MKNYYIVKKSIKRGILNPKEKIALEVYQKFIDNHCEFTWLEDTKHGKKWDKTRPVKKRLSAYINYTRCPKSIAVHWSKTISVTR